MMNLPKKEPLNLVPFIDIMLVLLAMVLSVSTFIAKGKIPVSLPKSETAATAQTQDQSLLVHVDAAGDVFWENEKIEPTMLSDKLASVSKDTRIVLRIDKDARFDRFITVIDFLKKHNHDNFTIAAEKAAAGA